MSNNLNKILVIITVILLPFLIANVSESLIFIDAYIVYIVSSIQILCLVFLFSKQSSKK